MNKLFFLSSALLITGSIISAQTSISPRDAKTLLSNMTPIVLLDVRTAEEFATGYIPGAILLPYDLITEESAAKAIPEKDTMVIVYCRSGRRSSVAAKTLRALGYTSIRDLGGINSWPYDIVQ